MAAGLSAPRERELVEVFGIARNTLRAALAELERDGIIERHVGRGTFIAQPKAIGASTPEALLKRRSLTPARLATYRKQHRKLFNALMARDALAAREACREHLLTVKDGMNP